MNLNKKRESNLLFLSIILIFFEIFFLYWLNPIRYNYNKIILSIIAPTLLLILLINKNNSIKVSFGRFLYVIIFFTYIILNYLIAPFHNNFRIELLTLNILPLLILKYFEIINNRLINDKILHYLYWFFNIFNVINCIIIILQINIPYFMMDYYSLSSNKFYLDHLTGLIGMNGTHILSILYCIVIYLNLIFINNKTDHLKKALSPLFLIFTLISSILISTYNDNKSYYFMLALYFIPVLLKVFNGRLTRSAVFQSLKYLIVIFGIVLFLFINPTTKHIIIDKAFNNLIKVGVDASGTDKDERISLFNYSLSIHKEYPFGVGIGGTQDYMNTPSHMGISELSAKTFEGGLFYLILFIVVFYHFYSCLLKNNKIVYKIFVFMCLMFAVYYQQLFLNSCENILFNLLFIFIGIYINKNVFYEKNEVVRR